MNKKKFIFVFLLFAQLFSIFSWTISFALIMVIIYVNYPLQQLDSKATSLDYGLYDALRRIGWSIALCFIIFACHNNCGGCVNWFLSHPFWQPISRLSYSIYMLHYHVLTVTMVTLKTPPLFNALNLVRFFIMKKIKSIKYFMNNE